MIPDTKPKADKQSQELEKNESRKKASDEIKQTVRVFESLVVAPSERCTC